MNITPVYYFDGQTSTPHTAQLCQVVYQGQTDGFVIHWQNKTGAWLEKRYFTKDCEHLPALDGVSDIIMLADGARIEFLGKMPAWLDFRHQKLFGSIKHMENHWSWIGGSVILLCVFIFGLFRFGIPLASHHIAHNLPQDILTHAGEQAESYVMDLTKPSNLPKSRQDEIVALYQKIGTKPNAKIIVRAGAGIGANALAILNNTIVITDELIKLSNNDHEILAVLAHEQGHLVHRHSLEQAISSLGMGVLVVVITGDTSDILLALPTLLATTHYSQKAELEADKYAIDTLKRLNVSPTHLANFFEKMQKEHDDGHGHWSMLSTHPETDKRIEQVKKHSE